MQNVDLARSGWAGYNQSDPGDLFSLEHPQAVEI
jgi:hypothetical protein